MSLIETNNPEEPVPFIAACAELGIKPNTGHVWSRAGKFPRSFKIGGRRFVARDVLDTWKAEQKRLSYEADAARRIAREAHNESGR